MSAGRWRVVRCRCCRPPQGRWLILGPDGVGVADLKTFKSAIAYATLYARKGRS